MADLYAPATRPNFEIGASLEGLPLATKDDVDELRRLWFEALPPKILDLALDRDAETAESQAASLTINAVPPDWTTGGGTLTLKDRILKIERTLDVPASLLFPDGVYGLEVEGRVSRPKPVDTFNWFTGHSYARDGKTGFYFWDTATGQFKDQVTEDQLFGVEAECLVKQFEFLDHVDVITNQDNSTETTEFTGRYRIDLFVENRSRLCGVVWKGVLADRRTVYGGEYPASLLRDTGGFTDSCYQASEFPTFLGLGEGIYANPADMTVPVRVRAWAVR